MKRVYLAGPITEDPDTHNWRKKVAKLLGDKFAVDDPCASKFDREMLKEADGDAQKVHEIALSHQSEILLPKSYQSVENCDIILVNFTILPSDRPVIGTLMEIAWAWMLHKVIIVIEPKETNSFMWHPMVNSCTNAKAETLEEAVEVIKEFFTTRR